MKKLVVGLALGTLVFAGTAHARNFHVAGGVQYVVQGMAEKDKKNYEDANRIFNKAVVQLNQGLAEDPKDNEGWGYLGWAYAELDSAPQAGRAFEEVTRRVAADPKALKRWQDNQKSYWVKYYNEGLAKYRDANAILPLDQLLNSTDPKAAEAKTKLAEAEASFKNAAAIAPREVSTYNNLAVVAALQGNFDAANAAVEQGLSIDPKNEDLLKRKANLAENAVTSSMKGGDYKAATAKLDDLIAKNPTDFPMLVRGAQTYFEYGDTLKKAGDEAGAKAAFTRSAEYFGKAGAAAPDEQNKLDMPYNQAVALQNAGDDKGAAKVAFDLVQKNPKDRNYQSMLRGAYDRMGSKQKANDQVWAVLGLNDDAKAVADVAAYVATVPKTSDAGKVLAANGAPEEVKQFTSGSTQVDVWYYWTKKTCFAFAGWRKLGGANFGDFGPENGDPAPAPAAGGTKKKG